MRACNCARASPLQSRTCEGCDGLSVRCRICYEVSIHAPAWGATPAPDWSGCHNTVSIHAPAWGATQSAGFPPSWDHSFNPRTRVGCDAAHCPAGPPVRGFNPRTRVVRRGHGSKATDVIKQSTCTRVGCDLLLKALVSEGWKRTFQFHAPVRCDERKRESFLDYRKWF